MCELTEFPVRVVRATVIEWGVTIDAYLLDAAMVGNRYTGLVYQDLSGVNADGMTVVTPEVRSVRQQGGFTLVRSLGGHDHYVIVCKLS